MIFTTKSLIQKLILAKRLLVARVLLVIIGAAGAYIASFRLTSILGSVAWAFDFAMSGLFFPLVLGVWWKRATRQGAIAGIIAGIGSGLFYLLWVYPKFSNAIWGVTNTPILGIDHLRFGLIGAPICLVVMVVVSLMTKEPSPLYKRWLMTLEYQRVNQSLVNNSNNNYLKLKGAIFSPLFF